MFWVTWKHVYWPFPRNGRLFLLNYSSLQVCHQPSPRQALSAIVLNVGPEGGLGMEMPAFPQSSQLPLILQGSVICLHWFPFIPSHQLLVVLWVLVVLHLVLAIFFILFVKTPSEVVGAPTATALAHKLLVVSSFLWTGLALHSALSLNFWNLMGDSPACFMTSSSRVCLMASLTILSPLGSSRHFKLRSLVPSTNAFPVPQQAWSSSSLESAWWISYLLAVANSCRGSPMICPCFQLSAV